LRLLLRENSAGATIFGLQAEHARDWQSYFQDGSTRSTLANFERHTWYKGRVSDGRPMRRRTFSVRVSGTRPGGLEALEIAGDTALTFLQRHITGNWGDLDEQDRAENELCVRDGFRTVIPWRPAL
jgi:hypothetical protein